MTSPYPTDSLVFNLTQGREWTDVVADGVFVLDQVRVVVGPQD
jgi:hypothetical protein